ncbi:hypothetical protein GP486_000930 [Trichoglossum hirsutum]|uniref:Uncharacterized protein n=1 Tax=Trichoglossum hirsutum TaxID=265104 RepID=A0A9P8LI42_9PEZI|nr:hypothetical protein GP486_000930 [Trichoglossum hirsutum]
MVLGTSIRLTSGLSSKSSSITTSVNKTIPVIPTTTVPSTFSSVTSKQPSGSSSSSSSTGANTVIPIIPTTTFTDTTRSLAAPTIPTGSATASGFAGFLVVTNPSNPAQSVTFASTTLPQNQRAGLPHIDDAVPLALLLLIGGISTLATITSTFQMVFPLGVAPAWLTIGAYPLADSFGPEPSTPATNSQPSNKPSSSPPSSTKSASSSSSSSSSKSSAVITVSTSLTLDISSLVGNFGGNMNQITFYYTDIPRTGNIPVKTSRPIPPPHNLSSTIKTNTTSSTSKGVTASSSHQTNITKSTTSSTSKSSGTPSIITLTTSSLPASTPSTITLTTSSQSAGTPAATSPVPTRSADPINKPACRQNTVPDTPSNKLILTDGSTTNLHDLLIRMREVICNDRCEAPQGVPDSVLRASGTGPDCEIAVALPNNVEAYMYRNSHSQGSEWQQCWDSTQYIIDKCIWGGPNTGWWSGTFQDQFYEAGVRPLNGDGNKHSNHPFDGTSYLGDQPPPPDPKRDSCNNDGSGLCPSVGDSCQKAIAQFPDNIHFTKYTSYVFVDQNSPINVFLDLLPGPISGLIGGVGCTAIFDCTPAGFSLGMTGKQIKAG